MSKINCIPLQLSQWDIKMGCKVEGVGTTDCAYWCIQNTVWDLGTLRHTGDVSGSKDGSISVPHHLKVFNQNLQAEMCRTDSMSSLIPMHHGVLFKGIKRRKSKPSKNSLTCFCMDVTQALHKEWHELEINCNCIYIVHEKQFRKVITFTPHVYEEHTHFTLSLKHWFSKLRGAPWINRLP